MDAHDIIVIGASLGGLDALSRVAAPLPADLPAALLVVLHTGSDSPRLLATILKRRTALAVSYGTENEVIRCGHIYFAPPNHHMMVAPPGVLTLKTGPKVRYSRPAADCLFESAAKVYGSRVIGVVLTGGDHDGTDGMRAIKAAGGLCIVQLPVDALAPGMPTSAIQGDHPDYAASADEIGALLVKLTASPDYLAST
jgi:two-component system chemotaxis response regulator CheB